MCCCSTRIVQIGGGGVPFTFSVTAGNSPYNGGLGVITGPLAINSGDILHLWSANTIDFDVTPGSVNAGAEVRIDPNPLNTLSVSAAGLMGSAAPFTFDIGHNVGANYTINNGDTWKISSGNNTIDTVNMGGLISGFNVRIDPAPGNAITTSVNGLFVPTGGVNIYNSDGTITDPTRTVTVGASTLNFNADNGGFFSNVGITTNQFAVTYSDNAGYQGLNQTTSTNSVMENQHPGTDEGARVFTSDAIGNDPIAGIQVFSGIYGTTGIDVNSGGNLGNYINFYNNLGPYFELRLNGSAGLPGEVLTSNGPGVSPVWGPITVTANSLDNLFFTQDIDWDFGGNNWNISNIDNWNVAADDISFTSNTFDVSAPIACFSGITQNDALTRFLVQDVGGCLSWRDASTVGGDRDWLTIQTNNQENQEFNNAYRVGGIGIIGSPHGTTFPFDSNDLIFDIEVAGGTRNTIGVNGIYGGQASFQIIDNDGGPTNSWSAISIGDTVAAPIGVPTLFNIGGPGNRNLAISHVSDGVLGQGDVPLMQFYGQGTTNLGASIIVTDIQSGNSTSVPYQDNFSNGGSNIFPTPLLYVASENKTPVLKLRNTKNTSPNDHAAGIVFESKNGNAGGGKAWIGLGADMNGAGVIADPLSADVLYLGTSTFGGPIADTHVSINPQGGVAIYNGGAGSLATVEDLYVSGLLGQIRFAQYDELRDDTGAWTPINFLYTNFDGTIKSAPIASLGGGGGLATANNGLNVTPATNVRLGGPLIMDTSITGAAHAHNMTWTDLEYFRIEDATSRGNFDRAALEIYGDAANTVRGHQALRFGVDSATKGLAEFRVFELNAQPRGGMYIVLHDNITDTFDTESTAGFIPNLQGWNAPAAVNAGVTNADAGAISFYQSMAVRNRNLNSNTTTSGGSDFFVTMDTTAGNRTLTLQGVNKFSTVRGQVGRMYVVKKPIAANTLTIIQQAGDTIDGSVSNYVIPAGKQGSLILIADSATNWSIVSDYDSGSAGGPIPINSLLSATGTNAIDNLNFNQTWEWNTLTNQNGLQLESSSITTGSLLQLDTNVSGARTGRLVNVLSTNSTTGFRGIQVTTNDTSTEGVNITQVGQGRALRIETANQGPIGTGPALVEIERTNALSAGENLLNIQSAGQDTGIIVSTNAQNQIVASFNGDNLTSGNVVRAQSTAAFGGAVMQAVGSGAHTGQVLDVQSTTSTANFTNGAARFFFGGNHLGTGLLVQDFSTAGRAMLIDSGVTTGIGLKIEATSVSSGAAVDIETAASNGSIFINFSEGGVQQGSITNGAGNTVLYNTTSDRNLKENIELSDLKATAVINAIDVVEYNFKADQDKNTLHGLIAQDLYEIYPEAVTKGGGDKPWSIDYSKLVPVLLKSIQELSLRILVLENQ